MGGGRRKGSSLCLMSVRREECGRREEGGEECVFDECEKREGGVWEGGRRGAVCV